MTENKTNELKCRECKNYIPSLQLLGISFLSLGCFIFIVHVSDLQPMLLVYPVSRSLSALHVDCRPASKQQRWTHDLYHVNISFTIFLYELVLRGAAPLCLVTVKRAVRTKSTGNVQVRVTCIYLSRYVITKTEQKTDKSLLCIVAAPGSAVGYAFCPTIRIWCQNKVGLRKYKTVFNRKIRM